MINFDHKVFYSNYGFEYYLYKLGTLKAILADVPSFNQQYVAREVNDIDQVDYTRFIKSEIRMTCFHAIETLFELVFALEPKNGVFRDEKLLQSLTTVNSKENYSRIRDISNGSSGLNFLDVFCDEQAEIPVWLHIFYFQCNFKIQSPIKDDLLESGRAIKYFLSRIAEIFSDRGEYNAYKHGIRIMNTLRDMSITSVAMDNPIHFDLTDTMSLFSIEKDSNKNPVAEVVDVIPFDSKLDINITQTCYYLMMNIIGARRISYSDQSDRIKFNIFNESEMKELLLPDFNISIGKLRAKNPINF